MRQLKTIFRQIPLFLLTIPLFIVIHLEQEFHRLIDYRFVYKDILLLFLPPLLVMPLAVLLLKKRIKAGIFSCALLMTYYFFSDLKDLLYQYHPQSIFSKYLFLLPVILLLLIALFIYLRHTQSPLFKITSYINLAFLLFILADIALLLLNFSGNDHDLGDKQKKISRSYIPCDTCIKPDIYYIVFDAYTSSPVLDTAFNFHNPVDSILRQKGFYIVSQSRSNYNLTPFSISSSFNLQYLPGVDDSKEYFMNEYIPGLHTVYKSEWVPILTKEGYQVINHSIFNLENHPPVTPPYNLWDIDLLYSRMNIFNKIDQDIGYLLRPRLSLPDRKTDHQAYAEQRDKHFEASLKAFKHTINIASAQPRFVYAHFMIPHPPYTYDSSGRKTSQYIRYLTPQEDKTGYKNQVIFTNTIMLQLVSAIQTQTHQRPWAIIIQGDHGYRSFTAPSLNHLQFNNFNAIYFSNGNYHQFTDSMTNVNTFRAVANTFFNQHFPMLKDTFHFLHYH